MRDIKIPDEILKALESEIATVNFGVVSLKITRHDGHSKFRMVKKVSFIPGKQASGSGRSGNAT